MEFGVIPNFGCQSSVDGVLFVPYIATCMLISRCEMYHCSCHHRDGFLRPNHIGEGAKGPNYVLCSDEMPTLIGVYPNFKRCYRNESCQEVCPNDHLLMFLLCLNISVTLLVCRISFLIYHLRSSSLH